MNQYITNSVWGHALLARRRASSSLKKGMFLNVEGRLLGAWRASIGCEISEKDLQSELTVTYCKSMLPPSFLSSINVFTLSGWCMDVPHVRKKDDETCYSAKHRSLCYLVYHILAKSVYTVLTISCLGRLA